MDYLPVDDTVGKATELEEEDAGGLPLTTLVKNWALTKPARAMSSNERNAILSTTTRREWVKE